MKKRISLATLLVLACTAVVLAGPDFSGTWTLNREKSELPAPPGGGGGGGGRGGAAPRSLVIEQTGDTIKITRTTEGRDGQTRDSVLNYKINGEVENTAGQGAAFKISSKTSGDKVVSVYTRTMDTPNGSIKIDVNETLSLSPDGKTLTIDYVRRTEMGEFKSKQVFDKK